MFSQLEAHRLREGMRMLTRATTYDWRFYFSYLLGRPVTLAETDEFLRAENELHTKEMTCVSC
jgi:hypothetical protein